VDGNCVRGRRRAHPRVFPRPEELRTYRVWRRNSMCFIALRDSLRRLEHRDPSEKGATLLGSDGIRLRNLVVCADSLDLL
jgi:hypothetical protein